MKLGAAGLRAEVKTQEGGWIVAAIAGSEGQSCAEITIEGAGRGKRIVIVYIVTCEQDGRADGVAGSCEQEREGGAQ